MGGTKSEALLLACLIWGMPAKVGRAKVITSLGVYLASKIALTIPSLVALSQDKSPG